MNTHWTEERPRPPAEAAASLRRILRYALTWLIIVLVVSGVWAGWHYAPAIKTWMVVDLRVDGGTPKVSGSPAGHLEWKEGELGMIYSVIRTKLESLKGSGTISTYAGLGEITVLQCGSGYFVGRYYNDRESPPEVSISAFTGIFKF